jgi:hypothetical protein
VVAQLREVSYSPSPLSRLLQDPAVLEMSKAAKQKGHRSSRSRERRTPSLTTIALVEEERHVNHLRALLRSASNRLEYEIRRADEAEARGQSAELRAKDITGQLLIAERAKREAETGLQQSNAESRRYQIQLEHMEIEMRRLKADILSLEKENERLEGLSIKAKETSRQYQTALRDYQAWENDKEVGRQMTMQRWFEQGRDKGWSLGHKEGKEDGFDEGIVVGRKEGLLEGIEHGKNEERKKAMEAFDRFVDEEMGDDEQVSLHSSDTTRSSTDIPAKYKDSTMGRVGVFSKFCICIILGNISFPSYVEPWASNGTM